MECVLVYLQVVSSLRTLAAALRVLRWPHLVYDCKYSMPQLYLRLLHLERRPDTDDGIYSVFCALRCSSFNSQNLRPSACLRQTSRTLRRTGLDAPFRNTCELVATTCAYLRVLSRFVRCCRNIFASVGKWSHSQVVFYLWPSVFTRRLLTMGLMHEFLSLLPVSEWQAITAESEMTVINTLPESWYRF